MPVHENPANRHERTTRISHSRWAISGTHPANRREFGDPFCSVLFCSHTGLPHMDSPLFKNTCRAASHGRPQFKNNSFKFPIPKFTIQFLSIQFHASRVPIMQFYTNSNDCSTFTTCSLSTRLKKRTTYLNPCIFVLFVKKTRNPHLYSQ